MSIKGQPYLLKITSFNIPFLLVGIFISLCQIGITVIAFLIDDIPITLFNINVTIYFTFVFGYVVYITRIIHNSHKRSFDKLLTNSGLSEEKRKYWKEEFDTYRNMWPETLIALLIGSVTSYFYLANELAAGKGLEVYYSWRAIQVTLVWILITQSTSIFVRNTTKMNKLSRDIPLDLIKLEKFMPLTKAGISSTLGFIGAYSFLFINGVDDSPLDNPELIVLIPSIIALLYTPLKGVRKRIIKAKEEEITLIDKAIDGDASALGESRLKNNLENLSAIDLINYRKMIESLIEIPLNVPTASRFIFYLIIPLLTWVAGSIVDKVVDYLIA